MEIGSDYGAGVVKFGLRPDGQSDPPVYRLLEGEALADWKPAYHHLSEFLMSCLCDVLCCGEYDTARRVLEKAGWHGEERCPEDCPGLDLDALLRQTSMYGADALCGCAYDREAGVLLSARVDRGDRGHSVMMVYQKKTARQGAQGAPRASGKDE